jgi:hypothetical protein
MQICRTAVVAVLFAAAVTSSSRALADDPESTVVAAPSRAAQPPLTMHKVAFGVSVGRAWLSLGAGRLTDKGLPVDDWREQGTQIVPTMCVGGDGYFVKFDFPIMFTPTVSSYGLGLYPLNYGHLFQRTGIFPFISAGFAGSAVTTAGQGISGASAEARIAAGVKVRYFRRLALSGEIGYAPFMAGVVVDKQRMQDLEQSAIDGQNVEPPPGERPARGGLGHGIDFLVGLEWL